MLADYDYYQDWQDKLRAEARAAKDFARADAIRDELAEKGWAIEDTAKGAKLKRL